MSAAFVIVEKTIRLRSRPASEYFLLPSASFVFKYGKIPDERSRARGERNVIKLSDESCSTPAGSQVYSSSIFYKHSTPQGSNLHNLTTLESEGRRVEKPKKSDALMKRNFLTQNNF